MYVFHILRQIYKFKLQKIKMNWKKIFEEIKQVRKDCKVVSENLANRRHSEPDYYKGKEIEESEILLPFSSIGQYLRRR